MLPINCTDVGHFTGALPIDPVCVTLLLNAAATTKSSFGALNGLGQVNKAPLAFVCSWGGGGATELTFNLHLIMAPACILPGLSTFSRALHSLVPLDQRLRVRSLRLASTNNIWAVI